MSLFKNKKAFTVIELIVVMAIIGVLVLLATPKFMGHTKEARFTKFINNTKQLENASERYYMDKGEWPKLSDEPYSAEDIKAFSEKIYDSTGKIIELDPDGKYYDIDYNKINKYVSIPDDKEHYIIQSPVGNIYGLEELTKKGLERLDSTKPDTGNPESEEEVPLYEFSTATFTNAGATGRFGPTQEQVDKAYKRKILEGRVSVNVQGYQEWIVPSTGTYRIETMGASFTKTANMKGDFHLNKGDKLIIVVGQQGNDPSKSTSKQAGSGGTFVVKIVEQSEIRMNVGEPYYIEPLIVSGGQGGLGSSPTIEDEQYSYPTLTNNGTGGGISTSYHGSGGGLVGNGMNYKNHDYKGLSFINGATGGPGYSNNSALEGGFGGGGGKPSDGNEYGGGGGYSGGNGNNYRPYAYGGGSYNSGENQDNSLVNRNGHGEVKITLLK